MLMNRLPLRDLQAGVDQLGEIDWDFATSASLSSFSNLHWYPCRFPSQVPAIAIDALTAQGDVVFDPFLGSGTTAVEAQRLSRRCIGIELNPVAVTLARSKTLRESALRVRDLLHSLRLGARRSERLAPIPAMVQGSKWYTDRVLKDLRRLWQYVSGLDDAAAILGLAAFSAILLPVCRETRHWGYVCDNTAPKGDYERNVLEAFCRVLDQYEKAYLDRDRYWLDDLNQPAKHRSVRVLEGDARLIAARLKDASADMVMTSPPYCGVTDYVKAQRLSLEWLGLPIEDKRQAEIGARSKRHRTAAEDDYLRDCAIIFKECRRVLKPGKPCVVLFGESSKRAPMTSHFISALREIGFRLEKDIARQISPRRRLAPSVLTERLLVFRS